MTGCDRILPPAVDPDGFAETADEIRFFAKVQRVGECWNWTGSKHPRGYGHYRLKGRTLRAHRVMFEWFYGPEAAEGLDVDHLCRNTSCVNPVHLEAVTHAKNVKRGETGKYPYGHRTHCDKGHEFTPGNTRRRSDCNGRVCIECGRAAQERYKDSHRDEIRLRDRERKRRLREARRQP